MSCTSMANAADTRLMYVRLSRPEHVDVVIRGHEGVRPELHHLGNRQGICGPVMGAVYALWSTR